MGYKRSVDDVKPTCFSTTGKVELKGGESPFSFLFGLRKLTPDQRHGDNATDARS